MSEEHAANPPGPALSAAPTWRREPYRLFFPLGILLSWAGVGHWLWLSLTREGPPTSVFHAMAQIQGFEMAFAIGFLFTAIPRRTQTPPAEPWEMILGLIAPAGTTIAAYAGALLVAQAFFGVAALGLIAFILRRFVSRQAGRRPPDSFVWLPLALAIGVGGSALTGVHRAVGPSAWWLHNMGKSMALEGLFLALIIGVGGMVIPLLTRGEAPADSVPGLRSRVKKLAHALFALVLVASFALEERSSAALGFALRAALTLGLLLWAAGIHRPPSIPGWHRWLVWAAAWLIPAGYALAALRPEHKHAGLHVVFIGGFALMTLAVGMHVSLAHAGYQRSVRGRSWSVVLLGALILVALVARVLMDFDPERLWLHMLIASAAFIAATGAWCWRVLPRLWTEAGPEEQV